MSQRVNLFNPSTKAHSIPQNTMANQNNNLSNLSASSNPSNAPRTSIRGNPRARPQVRPFLSGNKQQSYFFDLLKLLQNEKAIPQLQNEIATSAAKLEWIRAGPYQFKSNAEREKQFQDQYRGKSNLKLTSQELGFRNALMTQSKKLDDIWFRIIQVLARELSANKMMGVKILKKYIRESGIYKKFYISEIGQDVLKPNENQIQRFFLTSNPNVVDEKAPEFVMIVSRLIDLYFQEYTACVACLSQMVIHRRFQPFFQERMNERSFLEGLWSSYKSLSNDILIKKAPLPTGQQERSELYEDLAKKCFQRNTKLLISIIKLIYETIVALYDSESIERAFVNSSSNNFYRQLIGQLDSDIINFERIQVCCNVRAENFTKMITELFLSIFPFEVYYVKTDFNKMERLNQSLREIKSEALTPVRLLLVDQQPPKAMIRKFEELIKTGLWNVNNSHWKKWVGIFLKKYMQKDYMPFFRTNNPKLLSRIVGVCKMIVSSECNQFWEVSNQKENIFYLFQIQQFIVKSINDEIQSSTFNSVLPILTKLLGSLKQNHCADLINLVGEPNIKLNIFDLIIDTLKLNADREEGRRRERILYTSEIREQSIEQEMKFLCRLIFLQTKQLGTLQRALMDGSDQSIGVRITFMLVRCFQKITPEKTEDLKSLRYLMQAIDAIFLNEQTRMLVPIALGASQTSKQSHKKQLRCIIDVCVQPPHNSEVSRQGIKLRKVVGVHLNHIVKLSDSLEQFFPTATKTEDEGAYKRLYDYIIGQDEAKIDSFLKDPCLKSVPWFYYMLLILESDRLNSIDFETIRLLLLKMRLKKQGSKQQVSLNLVGDMINNGKVVDLIIRYLTPLIVKTPVQKKEKYVFGLSNQEFQLFMGSSIPGEVVNAHPKYAHSGGEGKTSAYSDLKYANKMYRFIKRKKEKERERTELYGRLSGSVSIIETILKLNLEDQYPLLQKLTLNKFIIDGLLSNNAHMFDVKFTVKLQNPRVDRNDSDKQTMSTLFSTFTGKRSEPMIERELQIKVSLLHTITSLIDFENRMQVDRSNHPSRLLKLGGMCYLDLEQWQIDEGIVVQILQRSRENILTEVNRHGETIGVSSVYKILEYLILLGHGRTVYFSLLYRNYPMNRYFPQINAPSQFVDEFFEVSLRMLTRNDISMRQKQYIFQFFSASLQQNHFSDYILSCLNKFKDSFVRIWKEMFSSSSPSTSITKVLLFFNLLLIKNSREGTVKFVKNCLVDPIKYGEQLIELCRSKLNQVRSAPGQQNVYTNLLWCSKMQQLAACKASLLLYLGITSYLMCSEQQILASAVCDLIIKEADTFLKRVPETLSTFGLDQLNLQVVHQYPQRAQLRETSRCCFFPFNRQVIDTLIFNSPCSIVENYLYQPWQIQSKAKSKHLNERNLVLQGLRVNASAGVHFVNQSIVQYYYLLIISLFERGNYGYLFTNITDKDECDRQTNSVLNFMEKKAKNGLSTAQLLGRGESILKRCFQLCGVVMQQIWGNNEVTDKKSSKVNSRDSGLMLLATLLKTMESNLVLQQGQSQQMTECFKIVDKLLIYVSANDIKFSLKVVVFLFEQSFRLSHKLLLKNLANKCTRQIFDDYFSTTNQILQFLLLELGAEIKISQYFEQYFDLLMLVLVILQKNIQNYELFQNSKDKLQIFLNNSSRYQSLQNLQKIILLFFPLLQNLNLNENVRGAIIQAFNKAFYIDTISKKYSKSSIISASMHTFLKCLEKITKNLSSSEVLTTVFISAFLAELGSYQADAFSRPIIRIMKGGFQLLSTKFQKYNEIRSLAGLVEMKNLFDLVVTIGSEQNWRNAQLAQMLNAFFVFVQQKAVNFDSARIIASSQFELQLGKRYVTDKNGGQYSRSKAEGNKSIFQLIVLLRQHEYLKFYLMFVTSSIKNSQLVFELCDMTINKGKLDELTWERIKLSLVGVINYYQRLTQLFEDSLLERVVFVNGHVCTDGGYLAGLGPISYYFENYESVEDFGCDVYQTVFLLYNTLTLFLAAWKGYDWKSRVDWKGSRKDLLNVYLNLLNRYSLFTRICKSNEYEVKLSTIKFKVKESIDLIEVIL